MKKIVFFIFGTVLLAALTVLNLELNNNYSHNDISLRMLKSAVAQGGENGTCEWVCEDPPWYCFWCDDGYYEGADEFKYWEDLNWCTMAHITDCYPGTGQCTPGYNIVEWCP